MSDLFKTADSVAPQYAFMDVGIALPNAIPGAPGSLQLTWARRAETSGFSTIAALDRVVDPSYDPLTVLAAAAGATSRVRLLTNVLLAPLRAPVMLAKEAASLDELCGRRLWLGLAPGLRVDDFAAAERGYADRFRRFDDALATLQREWTSERHDGHDLPVVPEFRRDGGIPLPIGGFSDAAIRRTVARASGWTAPGLPPSQVIAFAQRVRTSWAAAGRSGGPRLVALASYSLGDVADTSRSNVRHYYAFLGETADELAELVLRVPVAVRDAVAAFRDAGFHELIFNPTVADIEQLERLRDVVL